MAPTLLDPPTNLPPHTALLLSQKAPRILSNSPTSSLPWPLSLLFSTESPETWTIHENLLLACLETGDDKSARLCLDRLISRFGDNNERVVALRGLYDEATAKDQKALEKVLRDYEDIIKKDPTNFSIRKRRIALLRSIGRTNDAINALVELLDASPTDLEAWAELSDLYASQNLYQQAIYSLEEVLLITPNSWTVHARVAELHYLSALTDSSASLRSLTLSLRYYSRSIELCESYLRGYYGLKLACSRLISILSSDKKQKSSDTDDDAPPPSLQKVQKLHELATSKLAEMVRRYGAGESGWHGYDQAEVIAARELLDRDGKLER